MPAHRHAATIPQCPPAVIVRQTVCKSVLNRSGLGGYSLNCYTGCTHACVYCYARFMQRFHPHQEPWGSFVNVKLNAVETLKRQLRRAAPAAGLRQQCLRRLAAGRGPLATHPPLLRTAVGTGFPVHVLTKSAVVLDDLELFVRQPARVAVTAGHARPAASEAVGAGGRARSQTAPGRRGGPPAGDRDRHHVGPAACRCFPTARRPWPPCSSRRPTWRSTSSGWTP